MVSVEFKKVTYSVGSKCILDGLNGYVGRNETLAILGPSGSGKTTVVQLLQRFYDADAGRVAVDGIDVRELDPAWLRSRIGRFFMPDVRISYYCESFFACFPTKCYFLTMILTYVRVHSTGTNQKYSLFLEIFFAFFHNFSILFSKRPRPARANIIRKVGARQRDVRD